MILNIPEGFKPIERRSPFTDLMGQIYSQLQNNRLILAIKAEQKHCNARGFVHGGVLCTLADIAMGYNAVLASTPPSSFVTASLSVDYVGSAAIGDWITVVVDVQKVGGTLAFANCYIFVEDYRIARASAVFCRSASGTNNHNQPPKI